MDFKITHLLAIGLGGGLGSILRYVVAQICQQPMGADFPIGTLIVNVVGSAILGFLAAVQIGSEPMRLAIMIGFLGGFTTFSTFAKETFEFGNDGQLLRAGANIALNNVLAITVAWAGYRIAQRLYGAQ